MKKVCDINLDDHAEDSKLNFFIEQASDWILEYLDRHDIEKKSRTEFYNGTGTLTLQLRSRPVFVTPTIEVYVDSSGYYGQASGSFLAASQLTFGTDFVLKIDQDDGTSRCGLLIRIDGGIWPKQPVRTQGLLTSYIGPGFGCVKVTHTAGHTVDTLPAQLRAACNLLVTRMRYFWPLGLEIASESYEERHISLINRNKNWLMGPVIPMLFTLRNWSM